jgi:hypothetical protein
VGTYNDFIPGVGDKGDRLNTGAFLYKLQLVRKMFLKWVLMFILAKKCQWARMEIGLHILRVEILIIYKL